jgi:ribosomal protein S18 acetylase RimI-like enzyme
MGKKPGPMLDDYAARVAEGAAWVLEVDAGVAGLVVLLPEADHILLDNVAVDPRFAGRGIGRALIDFAEAETLRRGFAEIRLYTHETMTENIAIYPRLGYEETHRAEQAGYQRVFMRKKLAPSTRIS